MAAGTLLRTAAKAAVRGAAVGLDRVRPAPAGIVVLIYHRVGARTPTSVDLPTSLFADQVAELAETCRPVTLDEAAELLAGTAPVDGGRPPVVVTFDDGTADFVDEALPVLVEHGVPCTYYLATDYLADGGAGAGRRFPDDGVPMSWAAVREAVATGLVDVGSHTASHALLDRLPASEVAGELDRSIDAIATETGTAPRHFAYPKALLGHAAAEAEVRARFATATIARTRPNPPGAELHRLTRSPLQVGDGMDGFRRKVAGGMRLEDDLRSLVNRWRYRDAYT